MGVGRTLYWKSAVSVQRMSEGGGESWVNVVVWGVLGVLPRRKEGRRRAFLLSECLGRPRPRRRRCHMFVS
jgi:hypothetical protein